MCKSHKAKTEPQLEISHFRNLAFHSDLLLHPVQQCDLLTIKLLSPVLSATKYFMEPQFCPTNQF